MAVCLVHLVNIISNVSLFAKVIMIIFCSNYLTEGAHSL